MATKEAAQPTQPSILAECDEVARHDAGLIWIANKYAKKNARQMSRAGGISREAHHAGYGVVVHKRNIANILKFF